MPEPFVAYRGPLYRALNPLYARDPLSGEGARKFGGRFNAKGTPALYTAMSVIGAVNEANQIGRPFEPVTLVSYEADLTPLFDATDPSHLKARKIDPAVLAADDWRLQMIQDGESEAQRLATKLAKIGYVGMIVPSYAPGAAPGARNLVLWRWIGLRVVDNEARLSN